MTSPANLPASEPEDSETSSEESSGSTIHGSVNLDDDDESAVDEYEEFMAENREDITQLVDAYETNKMTVYFVGFVILGVFVLMATVGIFINRKFNWSQTEGLAGEKVGLGLVKAGKVSLDYSPSWSRSAAGVSASAAYS
ncbi:hypothetical protein TWF694_005601 [Orbilia ellipsospora]|uniref:Uncharacterized protein n=1 Tax=Orbilia ellipsospora TaxID=2528407 RepID=A0AAV9WTL8_9PEZI